LLPLVPLVRVLFVPGQEVLVVLVPFVLVPLVPLVPLVRVLFVPGQEVLVVLVPFVLVPLVPLVPLVRVLFVLVAVLVSPLVQGYYRHLQVH
jgi:hypothetical protein